MKSTPGSRLRVRARRTSACALAAVAALATGAISEASASHRPHHKSSPTTTTPTTTTPTETTPTTTTPAETTPTTTTPTTTTCTKTISPGASVAQLVNSLSPGQVGCLHAGTYRENVTPKVSGKAGAPITITSAPGERATIAGTLYIPKGSTYLTFSRLNLVGTSSTSIGIQVFGDNSTIAGNDITNNHAGRSCLIIGEYEGSWATVVSNTTVQGNRIHDCGMLANGAHDHGIYVASSRDATIADNIIYGNQGGWGVQLWADAHRTQVVHNVLDGNYNGNLIIAGGSYSSLGPSSNNTIRFNVLTSPGKNHNVDSYWQGGTLGTNNVVDSNCVYGAPAGDFGSDGGYSKSNNVHADPQYVDAAGHDYRLKSGSPCLAVVGYDAAAKAV